MKTIKKSEAKKARKRPCPRCNEEGIVDFIDLIRGTAEMHCRSCPTGWTERTEPTMSYLR